jgi:hypothetical protein
MRHIFVFKRGGIAWYPYKFNTFISTMENYSGLRPPPERFQFLGRKGYREVAVRVA